MNVEPYGRVRNHLQMLCICIARARTQWESPKCSFSSVCLHASYCCSTMFKCLFPNSMCLIESFESFFSPYIFALVKVVAQNDVLDKFNNVLLKTIQIIHFMYAWIFCVWIVSSQKPKANERKMCIKIWKEHGKQNIFRIYTFGVAEQELRSTKVPEILFPEREWKTHI